MFVNNGKLFISMLVKTACHKCTFDSPHLVIVVLPKCVSSRASNECHVLITL